MLLFIGVLWCIFESTKIAMRQFLAVFASLLVGGGTALAQTVDPSGAGPCGGQSTYNYNGAVYRLAEIGDQCWFADNLRSASFQNGDPITYANNGGAWTSFGSPRRGCVTTTMLWQRSRATSTTSLQSRMLVGSVLLSIASRPPQTSTTWWPKSSSSTGAMTMLCFARLAPSGMVDFGTAMPLFPAAT